uniref:Deoxynucleotidyltransferase terminal-interacting protein 1 n=1 Tax=Nothoprocta perdicaria TaxID=30464 RepID=A0A8C6Z3J9_NOTPE
KGAPGAVREPLGAGRAAPGLRGAGGTPARRAAPGKTPWNIMIKHRQVQRRGRRSQMSTSFTDPAVSMELLRAVLQPSINEEIRAVFNKYMKVGAGAARPVPKKVGCSAQALPRCGKSVPHPFYDISACRCRCSFRDALRPCSWASWCFARG